MTEIPEHLLKRAAERRAAMTGGAAPADAPAGDAPAAAPAGGEAPAAVAKAPKKQAPLPTLGDEPTPAKPDIPVVAAAKNRKRVPYWAASVLALLPLWAFIYVSAVQPPPKAETDPLVIGQEVYTTNCQSCHLADGAGASAGGAGQELNDGHVLLTFPDPLEMAHWIHFGYADGARPDGTYGDPKRPGGAMNTATLPANMPAFPSLTPEELGAVVIYIRSEFSPDQYKADDEQGFTAEAFEAAPDALAKQVTAVIAAGPGGDPPVDDIDRGE